MSVARPVIAEIAIGVHLVNPELVVEVHDLRVEFGGSRLRGHEPVVAVDGVSFSIAAGEIVGLVGESGSGKSTTAMAVARLIPLSSGTVKLGGRDISNLTQKQMRQARSDIQLIFQDPHGALDPRQSVASSLREVRRVHTDRTNWITDAELMASVGLSSDILPRLPHEISGGQAQRVCIAQSLILRPRVLIADEPTSALDVSVQAHVLELLSRLRDEYGIAVLLISHDLSVVRAVCDRVHVMQLGVVVESGETESVLGTPQHSYTKQLVRSLPGARGSDARNSFPSVGFS